MYYEQSRNNLQQREYIVVLRLVAQLRTLELGHTRCSPVCFVCVFSMLN